MKYVLALCSNLATSGGVGFNHSVHFFEHWLSSIYCVTDTTPTQAKMKYDTKHPMERPSRFLHKARALYGQAQLCVLSVPDRNEWHAVLLGAFYTVPLEASLQFGGISADGKAGSSWDSISHPHHLPKMSWLLISCRMSGCPPPSWSACICQVTSVTAATLSHS